MPISDPPRMLRLLLVVLVGGALLTGCANDRTYLPALLDDPMADFRPEEGNLIDSDKRAEGSLLGKPVSARVRRSFELPNAEAAVEAADEAAEYARSVGWEVEPSETGGYQGSRELTPGIARLSIGRFQEMRDPGRRWIVSVNLDFVERFDSSER